MSSNKKLNLEELKVLVFEQDQATKQNKDRLFKLAKAIDDIKTIEKMANELDFKSAKSYLGKKEKLSIDDAIKSKNYELFKKLVDDGIVIPKIKVSDLIEKKYSDEFIQVFIEKGFYVNTAQLVKKKYKQETIRLALNKVANIDDTFDNFTGLAHASHIGRTNVVEMLLKEFNPDIEKKYSNGITALWLALLSAHSTVVKILLKNGANTESRVSHGFTPLIQAASDGNLEIVQLLLDNKADIEAQSAKKGTPLILAVVRDNYKVVELLLEKGANPNVIEITGATALDCAQDENIIDILLKYNAKTSDEIEVSSNLPELIQAVHDENTYLIMRLIEDGHDLNIEFKTNTPLIQAIAQDSLQIIKILIHYGVDINYRTKTGLTPLIASVHRENLEIIKFLLENGADKNIKGDHGITALEIAASIKPNERIKNLLEDKISKIDVKSNLKDTMQQRIQNDIKSLSIKKLLELGSEKKVKIFFENLSSPESLEREIGKVKKDSTPFIQKSLQRKALLNEPMGTVVVILGSGFYDGSFIHEVLRGVKFISVETNIGYFLDFPLDTTLDPFSNEKLPIGIDWSNHIGRFIDKEENLIFVNYGNHMFIRVNESSNLLKRSLYKLEHNEFQLLKEYKNYDYKSHDLYASFFEIVKSEYSNDALNELNEILEKNIDIDKVNSEGKNALFLAIEYKNKEFVDFLIKKGAYVDVKNQEYFTPLMIATILDDFEICKLLVEKGADLTVRNFRGQDCALFAAKNMNPDIIMFYEEKGIDIQGAKTYCVNEFEEKYALEIVDKIEEILVDKKNVSQFLVYALNINYEYEMNLDEYVKEHNGYLINFRPGREFNFSKNTVSAYHQMHEKYLDSVSTSDESKDNIRTRIYDILMKKYQLGKYENSDFSEPLSTQGADKYLETLYINEENYNAEINIYGTYLLLNTINTEKGRTSFMYKKEKNNLYINQDRGDLIITKTKIIETDKNGGQNISDFTRIEEVEHNPRLLSTLLQKFSDSDNLSYTNHEWDSSTPSYDEFMSNLRLGWNEIRNQFKILLTKKTYEDIEMFLFSDDLGEKDNQESLISWGDGITVGWSSKIIVKNIKNGTKPNLINITDIKNTKIKTFGNVIDIFKSYIVIDDKKNKLFRKFTKLRTENQYNINYDKESFDILKEKNIEKFFTDVNRLENALRIILNEMNERSETNRTIQFELQEKTIKMQNITELKIIHKGSTSNQTVERLSETVNRSKGFKSIYENLKSVCDWSIDTICSDGKRYKIDYLYPEIDKDQPHWDEISDTIEGFTHILRFYR